VLLLSKNGSPGRDGIRANVLKRSMHLVFRPLLHILNLSFSTEVFLVWTQTGVTLQPRDIVFFSLDSSSPTSPESRLGGCETVTFEGFF
jgi:hypothetical protein